MSTLDAWFNDDIGRIRQNGQENTFSLRDVYATIIEMTKMAYFHYMLTTKDGDYEGFRAMHNTGMERIMRYVDETYADHVEGVKREVMEKQGQGDA